MTDPAVVTPLRIIEFERGDVWMYADAEALAHAAAALFHAVTATAAQTRNLAYVALSGGSTPLRMGEILAAPPYRETVPWSAVELFWGDERWVPAADASSNYGTAKQTLLDHVAVDPSRVNPVPTDATDPRIAAQMYSAQLKTVFGTVAEVPRFDLVFLGMGDDGHTASLFPGTPAIHVTEELVVANYVPKLDTYRITMTPPLLNAAREVVFLVSGAGKAEILAAVLTGPKRVDELPSQIIAPEHGRVRWLVDEAAAAKLDDASHG